MSERKVYSSVRLTVAAVGSLLLLLWLVLGRYFSQSIVLMGTVALCVVVLVVLTPVIIRGSRSDSWVALLVALFPALVLASTTVFTLLWSK